MNVKLFSIAAILAFGLTACSGGGGGGDNDRQLDPTEDPVVVNEDQPAGGVVDDGSDEGTVSEDTLTYTTTVDLFVSDAEGKAIEGLTKDAFSTTGHAVIDDVVEGKTNANEPFSTSVLVDQSGSIKGTDPLDLRIKSVIQFYRMLDVPNNAALFAFAGSGDTQLPDMVVPYSEGFTTSIDENVFESLEDKEGGWSPLFDSIRYVTDITIGAPNPHKAIVVLADGGDLDPAGTSFGAYDVTRYATANGIALHTVGLSDNISEDDADVLAFLARDTGGTYTLLGGADQLNAAVGSLLDILKGRSSIYSVTLTCTSDAPINVGDRIAGDVLVTLADGSVVTVPYIVEVQ